jgi:hypothetical protein
METLRRKKRRLIKRGVGDFKMNYVGNKAIEMKRDRIKNPTKKPDKGIRVVEENGVGVNRTKKT